MGHRGSGRYKNFCMNRAVPVLPSIPCPFFFLLLLRAGLDGGAIFEQVGVSVLDNVGKALMTKI